MIYRGVVIVLLAGSVCITLPGCKTKSKVAASSITTEEKPVTPAANISLYDKPLDVIKKHVAEQKWQLIYSVGGMTGKDVNKFEATYYTLKKEGKLLTEKDGKSIEQPYKWVKTRDIYTGDSIYVVSGVVQWKINGIDNDTLRISDNYVDGYGYSLIRVK